jgi:hypothetical protein
MGMGGDRHAPASLTRERDPLHIARKDCSPLGFDPWTVRPLASHYTSLATSAHSHTFLVHLINVTESTSLSKAQNKSVCQNYSNSSLLEFHF